MSQIRDCATTLLKNQTGRYIFWLPSNLQKEKVMKRFLCGLAFVGFAFTSSIAEDMVGKISKIVVRPHGSAAGKTSIYIYFSNITNDRFSCNTSPGYAEVTDNTTQVSTDLLNKILSVALTAYSTGNTFAVDFYGNSCSGGGLGYIYN